MDDSERLSREVTLALASRARLARAASITRYVSSLLGVLFFFHEALRVLGGRNESPFEGAARVVLGLAVCVGAVLAGWVFAHLLNATGTLLAIMAMGAESSAKSRELIEHGVIPALAGMAQALEQNRSTSGVDPAITALAEIREAIGQKHWGRFGELLASFGREHAAPFEEHSAELAQARQEAVGDLREKLEAARKVNDPDQAMSFRDDLGKFLPPEELREIDREVVPWLMGLIQKRLRAGRGLEGVAGLAARMAESFGGSPEGASLRAALPTLRRSAGLCARCAQPYTGFEDACPKCLAPAETSE